MLLKLWVYIQDYIIYLALFYNISYFFTLFIYAFNLIFSLKEKIYHYCYFFIRVILNFKSLNEMKGHKDKLFKGEFILKIDMKKLYHLNLHYQISFLINYNKKY